MEFAIRIIFETKMIIPLPDNMPIHFVNFIRQLGYASFMHSKTGQINFQKRLSQDVYPRFHIYIDERNGKKLINLHLDQKKPTYIQGQAHMAEYDSEILHQEKIKIEKAIADIMKKPTREEEKQKNHKEGFFSRLFNTKKDT